jgi:hypothetical protein
MALRIDKEEEPIARTWVDTKELDQIKKDRLDFGFDSIYFRYSELVEELSWYKEQDAHRNGNHNFNRKNWCDTRRMHFYGCLEQLLHAHEDRKDDIK